MPDFTERHAIPYLTGGDGNADQVHNEALDMLSQLAGGGFIKDRDLNAAPSATEGEAYIVASTVSTGDEWEGEEGNIAVFISNSWTFIQPGEGTVVWIEDEEIELQYLASQWVAKSGTFSGYNTGNQSFTTSAIDIQMNTEIVKNGNFFHNDATNGDVDTVEIKDGGLYDVEIDVTCEISSGSGETVFRIFVRDDGFEKFGSESFGLCDTSQPGSASIRQTIAFSAGDKISAAVVRHAGSATLQTRASACRMTIRKAR